MRRFVTVVAILFFTIPFGISVTGCSKKSPPVYCNGGDSGAVTGQLTTITLQPKIYGVSINQAEISQTTAPSATDCKGSTVSVGSYTYATSDMTTADINPTTGSLCGGTWNRNSGGGVADYTTCMVTGKTGVAYITASSGGISSNQIPVYVHPIVTSVVLGSPSTDCTTSDPSTNCSPAAVNSALATSAVAGCPTSTQYPTNPQLANGCCTFAPGTVNASSIAPVTPYLATGCLSQQTTGQLSAKVYAGTPGAQTNISCQVGHITYTAQTPAVVTVDQNGVATAQQPGSTIITTTLSQAGSSAGFFSTCPPVDIALSYPGTAAGTNNIIVAPNNTQPVTATITDQNGVQLTGLTLEYVSTTPTTIPAASTGSVTPIFPGEAGITAICQPPSCNPAPYSEIGLYGNGKPVSSHAATITTPGTNSTDLYIASTGSRYLVPVDFTQTNLGSPILLPYAPNSMVISTDGSSIYMGSDTELMAVSALTGAVTQQITAAPGTVLSVSPDSSTVVVADSQHGQIYLYSSAGVLTTTYGYIPTYPTTPVLDAYGNKTPLPVRAAWSPDSQTVYIAAQNQILVYSRYTGWSAISPATTSGSPVLDVTVTEPAVGAYFAGTTTTARSYCPVTTLSGTVAPYTATNMFFPSALLPADPASTVMTDRVGATSDGMHILGATAASDTLSDLRVTFPTTASGAIVCPPAPTAPLIPGTPLTFSDAVSTTPLSTPNAQVTPTAITGILTTSNASYDFVTYTGTGGVLPAYQPLASQSGTATAGPLTDIPLLPAGSATAPVAGVISADNSTIYVGTSGDNLVHIISITGASPLTDTRTIAPNLPVLTGTGYATPNLLVQKPRPST